jgi:hypothetical protein
LSGKAPQKHIASEPPIASMSQPEHQGMDLPSAAVRTKARDKHENRRIAPRRCFERLRPRHGLPPSNVLHFDNDVTMGVAKVLADAGCDTRDIQAWLGR